MWRKHFCLNDLLPYFAGKVLTMKNLAGKAVTAFSTVLTMLACGLSEIGGDQDVNPDGGIWGGPVEDNDGAGILQQICYMTAMDYRDGYNWLADQERGSVKCSLVVYADGRQIMKVPVGEEYETGSDPDMHRIINGHLYTDYSTSDQTVIKRDGIQMFRYPGRESICGMRVSGEDIYTVGQNRSGEGFAFRKNGEVLMSREAGGIIGTVNSGHDSMPFAFYEAIRSSEGDISRYYVSRGGKVSQVAVRDDIQKVWDIICGEDTETYVASLVGVASPVMFVGGSMVLLTLPKKSVLLSASLYGSVENPGVELLYSSGSAIYSMLWQDGKTQITFPKGRTASSVCVQNEGLCCAVNSSSSSAAGLIYRCGELHDMPAGYSCVGGDVVCMVNGILNVGLSSRKGDSPLIWKDGETQALNINGYISSVCAQ